MKVLLIGKDGQLGRALCARAPSHVELVATQRADLDLERADTIEAAVTRVRPNVVINAAAYTAVDQAESESARAYAVNGAAPAALAQACQAIGARLLHVSTDYVFDGSKGIPYRPLDAVNPLNVYGASKLQGERAIAATTGLDWTIVRTAWVYAAQGKNFVRTMLRLFGERERLIVVSDQVGTPTSASSLARCLWKVVDTPAARGILHFTDAGVASWYDFAVAIYEEARALGLPIKAVEIVPVNSDEYKTVARRPFCSVLDKKSTVDTLGISLVHWRDALREVLGEIARA